jgi:hypothetical protein
MNNQFRSRRKKPSRTAPSGTEDTAAETAKRQSKRAAVGSMAGLATPISSIKQGWKREWHEFALALLAGAFLLSFGVKNGSLAIGLFCTLSGIALLVRPRLKKLGSWLDTCMLLLVILPLLGLLPAVALPFLSWRDAAVEATALPLAYSLVLSQSLMVEVWLLLMAAIAWLYCMRSRPLDSQIRPVLCMVIAWLGGVAAAGFLLAQMLNHGTEVITFVKWLGHPELAGLILAATALIAYGVTLDGVRHKRSSRILIFIPLLLISLALVVIQSALAFSVLAIAILFWTFKRLSASADSRTLRYIVFAVLIFAFHATFAIKGWRTFFHADSQLLPDTALAQFVLSESPILGLGAGQASQWGSSHSPIAANLNPQGFAFWIEFGVLGCLLLLALVYGFLRKIKKRSFYIDSGYRPLALVSAAICLLGIVLLDGYKNPIALFLLTSLSVLSLGHGRRFQGQFFSERRVRFAAWFLILCGSFYLFTFATALPLTHAQRLVKTRIDNMTFADKSEPHKREAFAATLNDWVILEPLNAIPYQQRAIYLLSNAGDAQAAQLDFARARHLSNHNLSNLSEEAAMWSRYIPAEATAAWSTYLQQAAATDQTSDLDQAYTLLLNVMDTNPALQQLAREYRKLYPELRFQYIVKLQGQAFFSEIEQTFTDGSLNQASAKALRKIATEAAKRSAFDLAARITHKMDLSSEIGRDTQLAIEFQRGRIVESLRQALRNFKPMDMPEDVDVMNIASQEEQLLRFIRSHSPQRLEFASQLMAYYIKTEQINRVRTLMRQLIRQNEAPQFALKWLAMSLFQQGDHVESWEVLCHQFPYLDIFYQD